MSGTRDERDAPARAPGTGAATGATLMQRLDPLVRAWERQFLNRALPHALQQPDGSYRWVFRRCDARALRDHLAGDVTIAVSSLSARGTCRWVCLDADAADGLERLRLVQRAFSAAAELPGVLEASRRGGHLWLFFARAVPAALARGAIRGLLDQLVRAGELPTGHKGQEGQGAGGLQVGGLGGVGGFELYPDHDGAQGRLGHAVRLPLGVHRRTGERYPIFDAAGSPLPLTCAHELLDCMEVVLGVPRIEQARLAALAAQVGVHAAPPAGQAGSAPTTRARPVRSQETDGLDLIRPDRGGQDALDGRLGGTSSALICWVDARVSPLELLDELRPQTQMRRVGQGYLGWCPFHDDRAPDEHDGSPGTPSFYVVHNARHGWSWRCLSSNCAHSACPMRHSFRLFQELLGLEVREALHAAEVRWIGVGLESESESEEGDKRSGDRN